MITSPPPPNNNSINQSNEIYNGVGVGATSKWHAHVDYPPQCPHPTPKPNEQKSRRWGYLVVGWRH